MSRGIEMYSGIERSDQSWIRVGRDLANMLVRVGRDLANWGSGWVGRMYGVLGRRHDVTPPVHRQIPFHG